jgi:hypothetical protein
MPAEPAAPVTETPSRRAGGRTPGRPAGRPARQPGEWLPRLFYDREIVEATYAFLDSTPREDVAPTDIDAFAAALRGLPTLDAQQLLEPYLAAAEPPPADADRRRGAWPHNQALPDTALRARANARMLLESDLVLLWRRLGKARYTQQGFREHLGEMPGREFRAVLREVVNGGEADEGLVRRIRTILSVREEDERRGAADDWMGAKARVMALVGAEEPGIAARLEDAKEQLTEFRGRHPGYMNISPNQSWADVERYLLDCQAFVERLGIKNEHLNSLVGEVYDEWKMIKDWVSATAGAVARNRDASSPGKTQLLLEAPGDGTPRRLEIQDTAPAKSLKRKRAPEVESSSTKYVAMMIPSYYVLTLILEQARMQRHRRY